MARTERQNFQCVLPGTAKSKHCTRFSIKPGIRRIEESLRSLASKVHAQSKSLRGQARINFLNKTRSFHVYIN